MSGAITGTAESIRLTEVGVQVRVADARVDDADERLAARQVVHDVGVLDGDGTALLAEDGDLVALRHVELLLARVDGAALRHGGGCGGCE